MQIGRKIYYELATGNVILDTGERQGPDGCVVETTEDQDFQLYSALTPYNKSAVGVMQLNYGDYAQNFATYPYSIDVTVTPNVIKWGTTPLGQDLASVQAAKKAQLQNMYAQTLAAGFSSTASGTAVTYGFAPNDQDNMNQIETAIQANIETFPVEYGDIHGTVISLTQAQYQTLISDANKFKWAQVKQLRSLIGQVMTATTTDAVNAIQWTAATY